MSDYGTRGTGSIPGWAPIIHGVFFFLFSVIMLNYFMQVLRNCINDKNNSLTFKLFIYLSLESVREGLNLALLTDNLYGGRRFFFLKGKMIVHEKKL